MNQVAKNIILLLDTQNKSSDLIESFESLKVILEIITNSNHLAQHLAVGDASAAVANIHHNDEFELLEHVSKISLTYPEIPIVLLLPEPIQPSLNWGPKVFALVKPISAYTILQRLQFLSSTEFPYDGLLKQGMLLSLLDHCLSEKKSFRIMLNYNDFHTADLLLREGQWVSLYLDDGLRNDKLLLPFCWENALYKIEETSKAEVGEFEISSADYQKFRMELHSWLSLMEQLPDPLAQVRCNKKHLKSARASLPDKVKPLVALLDGQRDLFRVFLDCELRPFETAQHLGYLYYSKILEVIDPNAPAPPLADIPIPPLARSKEENASQPKRRSKELAAWIMDPLNAAKKLEEKLKKDIKESRRQEPDEKQFRPRRRTQPGLGKLIGLLSDAHEPDPGEDRGSWNNVSSEERIESHEFAKSFVMTLGGDADMEIEIEEPAGIPRKIQGEDTKKVTPERGNDPKDQSGSFKVTFSADGEIENVKRVVTQEMDIFGGSEELGLPEVGAVIIEGEGDDAVLEQDFENQAPQSGVIEFDFKDKVTKKHIDNDELPAKGSVEVSEDIADLSGPAAPPSADVPLPPPGAPPRTGAPSKSAEPVTASAVPTPDDTPSTSDLLSEIKEIPKIEKENSRISREHLAVDPERVSASQDALTALRKKRLKAVTGDEEESEDALSDKYQQMLATISKSDPYLSPSSTDAKAAYESFEHEGGDDVHEEEYDEDEGDNYEEADEDDAWDMEDEVPVEEAHATMEMETFTNEAYRRGGKGKYVVIVFLLAAAFALWFFKFRASPSAGDENSELKKNMAKSMMMAPVMEPVMRPAMVMKPVMAVKAPVMKPPAPMVPKPDPTIALKKKLRDQIEALYASHKKRRNRQVYRQMKKLVMESTVQDSRALELTAAIAFDYDGEVNFAEKMARAALKLDPTRAEAWWILALISFERGKKVERKTAFTTYFKLRPDDLKRKKLAVRMGYRP